MKPYGAGLKVIERRPGKKTRGGMAHNWRRILRAQRKRVRRLLSEEMREVEMAASDGFKVEVIKRAQVSGDILVEQKDGCQPTLTLPYRVESVEIDRLTAGRLADVMLCYFTSGSIDKMEVSG